MEEFRVQFRVSALTAPGMTARARSALRYTPSGNNRANGCKRPGLTLLECLVVLALIGTLFGLLIPAIQKTREAANRIRCANHLRQIGLALHQYHDASEGFPPGVATSSTDPTPFLSWSTRIAPYLEQEGYWTQALLAFQKTPEFWRGAPHPLDQPFTVYFCPSEPRRQIESDVIAALTSYLGVSGRNQGFRDGCLFADSNVRISDIIDGSSNTLLVGERPASADRRFGWWYAGTGLDRDGDADSVLGARERTTRGGCARRFAHFRPGDLKTQCHMFHFWSFHPGGAHFIFADGSLHFLSYAADEVLPALATRDGSEVVFPPDS